MNIIIIIISNLCQIFFYFLLHYKRYLPPPLLPSPPCSASWEWPSRGGAVLYRLSLSLLLSICILLLLPLSSCILGVWDYPPNSDRITMTPSRCHDDVNNMTQVAAVNHCQSAALDCIIFQTLGAIFSI